MAQSSADKDATISPTITMSTFSSLGFGGDAMPNTPPYTPDMHAVSQEEALSYYAGLHSWPRLLYRTGKEQWSPPTGSEAYHRLKELCEVFTHPIAKVWNHDLGWKVVEVLDAHRIYFTTIDVVRFRWVDVYKESEGEEEGKAKKPVAGPVTIWIGVFPESTSATAAYDTAQDVLALLKNYQITDVDIDFRESLYTREASPQLLEHVQISALDPLVDVVSPLTPTLGLGISTKARPDAQGTMALYLAEGGGSNRLLGLSCRHVLIGSKEANIDYVRHPSRAPKDVLLLGRGDFTNLVDSIKDKIEEHDFMVKYWRRQIEWYKEKEKGTNAVDTEEAKVAGIKTQGWVEEAEEAMVPLGVFLDQVNKGWENLDNRILGHILRSPAIALGVSEHRFTEDWGVFQVNRTKLGDGFQGNKMDIGVKMKSQEFWAKCFPHGGANWRFEYPLDRLLPLKGIITDNLMHNPDMWDSDGNPCLLVAKTGSATGTTIGRANGVFSIVRDYYFNDMSVHQTSMEWAIINYGNKSEVFSKPGDSGSIIADIRGRIGGMLTGSSGSGESFEITYATPFWWLLERIRANGFPNAHLDVVDLNISNNVTAKLYR